MNAKLMAAILAAGLAMTLLALALVPRVSLAGQIRKMYLTEERPGSVTLALGQSTALSFFSKPERVVPGSPQKLQIDFLGKDLTLTPLAPNPGNLIIYTKSGRYVILLKVGSAANYDDVVEIEPGRQHQVAARSLRLLEDSFRVEPIDVEFKPRKGSRLEQHSTSIVMSVATDRKGLEAEELKEFSANLGRIHCGGCRVINSQSTTHIVCAQPIKTLNCECSEGALVLRRSHP